MKKLIFILVSLLFISCGARKVNKTYFEEKKDSIVNTKIALDILEGKETKDSTSIITNLDSSEITITPIDSTKTIVVDGKSYKNVILKIKKSKSNTLYTNNKKESNNKRINFVTASKIKKEERQVSKTKVIDKKQNYWSLFWWILLILIIYLLWRNKQRLLNVL
jgi:ATP-dependent Zn protease